jgi:hypothetical protein
MPLPTEEVALARIRELAYLERVLLSRKARRETGSERLNYQHPDLCDMLYDAADGDCSHVEINECKSDREKPVVTFITVFLSEAREERELPPDRLFVEVLINPDHLYLLACKLDGSPE